METLNKVECGASSDKSLTRKRTLENLKFVVVVPRKNMSQQIDVTVPDSETLSSEKSKRFTVSDNAKKNFSIENKIHGFIWFKSAVICSFP